MTNPLQTHHQFLVEVRERLRDCRLDVYTRCGPGDGTMTAFGDEVFSRINRAVVSCSEELERTGYEV